MSTTPKPGSPEFKKSAIPFPGAPGYPYKKGQIVRVDGQVYEVAMDVKWLPDFNSWGSVWLVGVYPPIFTDRGGIELVTF